MQQKPESVSCRPYRYTEKTKSLYKLKLFIQFTFFRSLFLYLFLSVWGSLCMQQFRFRRVHHPYIELKSVVCTMHTLNGKIHNNKKREKNFYLVKFCSFSIHFVYKINWGSDCILKSRCTYMNMHILPYLMT